MNLQFYWEKLNDMNLFQKFLEDNKEAYLCSGFFIIDKKGEDNKQHFDYYLPNEKKIVSFEMENGGQKVPIEHIGEKAPESLDMKDENDFNFEFNEVEDIVEKALEENKVKNKIEKIMVSLQKHPESKHLSMICTVFLSGLGMANIHIDIQEKKVIHFEKKSLFNMMRSVK